MSADDGLTQTLGEKMAAVMHRYGAPSDNRRPCPVCPVGSEPIALPMYEPHLRMHGMAAQCSRCGSASKLAEHLAHVRADIAESEAAQAESFRVAHAHGERTAQQKVVGEAVREVLVAELEGLELLASKWWGKHAELAEMFGYATPVPWQELKARQRAWVVATVQELIKDGSIRAGS